MNRSIFFLAIALTASPALAFDPIEGAITDFGAVGGAVMRGSNGLIPQGPPISTQTAPMNPGPSSPGTLGAISCVKEWNPFMQQNIYSDRRASDAICNQSARPTQSGSNAGSSGPIKLNDDVNNNIKSLSPGQGNTPKSTKASPEPGISQPPTSSSTFINCDAIRAPLEQEFRNVNGDYGQMRFVFKRMWNTWPVECRYSDLRTEKQARDYENKLIQAENAKIQAQLAAQEQARIQQQYRYRPPAAPRARNPNCQQVLNSIIGGAPGYGSYENAQQLGNWYNANCL